MVPMLFMGEEWGSKAPFPFFCDFQGELADAVRNGRRNEFAGAYAKYRDEIPDPLDVSTFQAAMLDWEAREPGAGSSGWRWFANCWRSAGAKSSRGLPVRGFGHAQAGREWLADSTLAHGRRQDAALTANLSDQRYPPSRPTRSREP